MPTVPLKLVPSPSPSTVLRELTIERPSAAPSAVPSVSPSDAPSAGPIVILSAAPSESLSADPSANLSSTPNAGPSGSPTLVRVLCPVRVLAAARVLAPALPLAPLSVSKRARLPARLSGAVLWPSLVVARISKSPFFRRPRLWNLRMLNAVR
jgi:hypothetical protein